MITGTINEWRGEFGFIKPDDTDFSRVFVRHSQMPANTNGEMVGIRVEFDIGPPDDDTKTTGEAQNIKIIGRCEVEQLKPNAGTGTVIFWSDKGFGFIKSSDGRPVFFGRHSLPPETDLSPGHLVEFEYGQPSKKGPTASRVRPID
jgi:cold shock CspA family protein